VVEYVRSHNLYGRSKEQVAAPDATR
jgi:hypothetical protein